MRRYHDLVLLLLIAGLILLLSGCPGGQTNSATTAPTTTMTPTKKPAIYLYPTAETPITVSLLYNGRLTCTYPPYNGLWRVIAFPDGRLVNQADGREYSYLYWEGLTDIQYDFSRGFVVRGQDTAAFLQEKLAWLGLEPREYNEFIVYWLPQMQDNPYNLITFQENSYTDQAVLKVTPEPDCWLRVFMAYQPLSELASIQEQVLTPVTRSGFTVVEWGGTCVGSIPAATSGNNA